MIENTGDSAKKSPNSSNRNGKCIFGLAFCHKIFKIDSVIYRCNDLAENRVFSQKIHFFYTKTFSQNVSINT